MHEDHRFIEALRQHNPGVIREIYRQFAQQALRWIIQRNGSAADAEDVFQEAIMALFEKAQDPGFVLTCPLGALLHVLYSRKWYDRIRQKSKEEGVRLEEERRYQDEYTSDALSIAESAQAEQTLQQQIGAAFAQLSDLCRQLLTLLSNGIAPVEAAEQLQMNSVATLYRRKNACVQRWRELHLEKQ